MSLQISRSWLFSGVPHLQSGIPKVHMQKGGAIFDISPLLHLPNPVHHQILKLLHKYFWNPYHSILTVTTHNQSNHRLPQPFIPHTTVRIILLNQTLIHIHTHWHPWLFHLPISQGILAPCGLQNCAGVWSLYLPLDHKGVICLQWPLKDVSWLGFMIGLMLGNTSFFAFSRLPTTLKESILEVPYLIL